MDIEILANKEFVTFFSNGRILVTGKLFVRLTNADKPTKSISVNTTGKNQLRLYVDLSTNGNTSDHADWANARITCNP